MIYLLPDYGFCAGVQRAMEVLSKAAKEPGPLYLTHPLLHNKRENESLLRAYKATLLPEGETVHEGKIVFSAHGHDISDEKRFAGAQIFDATCPLISQRYERLSSLGKKNMVFLGKRGHPETTGFLSRFPDMALIDVHEDLERQIEALTLPKSILLVCQTTIGTFEFEKAKDLLSKKTRIEDILPLCPLYSRRVTQAIEFLEDKDVERYFLVVCGDTLSSNANEILRHLQNRFPGLEGKICADSEELPKEVLARKNLLLCSSTSISGATVEKMYSDFLRLEKSL